MKAAKKETPEQKIDRLRALREERDRKQPPPREHLYHSVYGMQDELRFGKHTGETIEEVLATDPGWIRWALENVRTFEVSREVEEELKYLDDPRRPRGRWSEE